MGKVNKKDGLKLTFNFKDETTVKYVINAYGLFCKYRAENQQPNISLENWLAANTIEASHQFFRYHAEQESKKQTKTEQTDKQE